MPQTIHAYLQATTAKLEQAGISTARLDMLVLLEDTLAIDRAHLLAHPEKEITHEQLERLELLVQRRLQHEPLAYIRNKTEFYGRDFYINHDVLEPRPESETMIDMLKPIAPETKTIIDVGTGSGALAITAALEIPTASVIGVDNDTGCLRVARRNATSHKANIIVMQSDLLSELTDSTLNGATLLCNLPYVPDNFHINLAAMHEPRQAIFGGPDGLDLYRRMLQQIRSRSATPKIILAESLPPQHDELARIAKAAGFVLEAEQDFIQYFRTSSENSGL